jgi:hypothetical protein
MQTANEVKVRATKLRESLVALGHPIKHGQCLDVISKLNGYADWNAYTADISVNLNRAERFVDEMLEAGANSSYKKFTQRFEEKYLVHFTEKVFHREVRGIREEFGDYIDREFLGCLNGDADPETVAKYPSEIRYLWRGVFENDEVLMVACIYCKDGTHHVSGFNLK